MNSTISLTLFLRRAISMAMLSAILTSSAFAVEPASQVTPSAFEIMERSQLAFYYPGEDMKAEITMDLIDRNGNRRTRVMTMLRMDEAQGGNQRYFIYFHEPGDVRRMTFMVWKYPEAEDDRWIFVPAVDLVRRIAANDKRSSFVGSDFTYEDVSGRDVTSDEHTLVREEMLEGRSVWVIQSRPKTPTDYTRRLSWIDQTHFLPLKEEYYDAQDALFRVFTADEIAMIPAQDGELPTVLRRTMRNVKTGHSTETRFTDVVYDFGLNGNDFSERRMRQPPRNWIR
jgi:hypothetical protein